MEEKTSTAKTKTELLIENVVLRTQKDTMLLLKEELAPFHKTIQDLDRRLKLVEQDVSSMKETLKPFTVFKRRMWSYLIYLILGAGVVTFEISEISKAINK